MQWSYSPQLKQLSASYPASYVGAAVNVDGEANVDGDGDAYVEGGGAIGAGSHHEGGAFWALAVITGLWCSTGITVNVLVRGSAADCPRAIVVEGRLGRRKSNNPACT